MDELVEILRYLKEHPEVTWSGAGLTVLAVLYFLITKLFALLFRKDPVPPVGSTFTHSGSGAVGKKVKHINASGASIGVLGNNAHVEGGIHHHYYDRTEQGIPLQRPKQAEHLVGREELLNDVLAALRPGKVVTLCGPGGIGKTALASRVAWELAPEREAPALFPDGLLFSSFYGRKDVSLAFDHLVRSYSDDTQDSSPEAVCRLLANKQALIILDGAEEADDLPAVLRCCGGCGVLITSRKRSDAPGRLFEVKPLDKLPAEEAFRLYSRGTACCAPTTTDEATVQAICQQLGGWPLALRLAGHYLRNTGESATDYLRFLAKVPFQRLGTGEHQDENAALLLRRSMEQVSENARLALAMAGCLAFVPLGREPLMALLNTDELRACDALNELVVYGLLERQGQRWQVSHALIQTFARSEQPLQSEDLERLAAYYIDFCKTQSAAGLPGYALLDGERVHCLRLMESCLERELWQEVQGLVKAITTYLDRQGHWTEQLSAVEMNLTAARKAGNRGDERWCLNSLGYTYEKRGERDKAFAWYEQSLSIRRELGDRAGEAESCWNIGLTYKDMGDLAKAEEHISRAVEIAEAIGHPKMEELRDGLEQVRAKRQGA